MPRGSGLCPPSFGGEEGFSTEDNRALVGTGHAAGAIVDEEKVGATARRKCGGGGAEVTSAGSSAGVAGAPGGNPKPVESGPEQAPGDPVNGESPGSRTLSLNWSSASGVSTPQTE